MRVLAPCRSHSGPFSERKRSFAAINEQDRRGSIMICPLHHGEFVSQVLLDSLQVREIRLWNFQLEAYLTEPRQCWPLENIFQPFLVQAKTRFVSPPPPPIRVTDCECEDLWTNARNVEVLYALRTSTRLQPHHMSVEMDLFEVDTVVDRESMEEILYENVSSIDDTG